MLELWEMLSTPSLPSLPGTLWLGVVALLYSHIHIQLHVYIYKYMQEHNQKSNIRTSMNERTHFFIKIYLSHFIFERVDVSCVCEMSWRQRQTAILTPSSSSTIAALLSHLGRIAQPWVTEGPKPSICKLILTLAPYLPLTRTAPGTWLYNCLAYTCFRCSYARLTGASLDWRLGRGSICNSIWLGPIYGSNRIKLQTELLKYNCFDI